MSVAAASPSATVGDHPDSIGVPALRITARDGKTSILLGSAHVGIEGMHEPDVSIFDGAKRLVVEHLGLDPFELAVVPSSGRAEWAMSLSEQELAVYLQRAACGGYSIQEALGALHRRSVQKANQISYSVCNNTFVQSRDFIVALQKPRHMPIDTLESDEWIERVRQTLPDSVAESGLRWSLAHDIREVWARIREAMNSGDYDGLKGLVEESIGSPENAAVMARIMVDKRNAAWMPKLRRYIDDGGAVIVVGAMHLPGPAGLIEKLRCDGYSVEAILVPQRLE